MSTEIASNLTRTKLQQLLAAVGSEPIDESTQLEVTEYDWHQPHYFNKNELEILNEIIEKIAKALGEKFTHLYNTDFNVTVISTTQYFAGELPEQILKNAQNDYYLAFSSEKEPFQGFVAVPAQTAFTLVKLLLGDTETEKDSNQELSQLEESLLFDTASLIIEALTTSMQGHYHFQAVKSLTKGQLPIELQGIEEICKIALNVNKADSKNATEAHIFIPCRKFAPVVGKNIQVENKLSVEDVSKAILEHLQQISVFITAQLAFTLLSFEEIMSLRSGDILLLDKPINEPIELIIEGQTVFHAQPAKSAGQLAVVITKLSYNTNKSSRTITTN